MKPELENSPICASRGDARSALMETSVMCKTNGGMWKPQKTFPHQLCWAAAINLRTPVRSVMPRQGRRIRDRAEPGFLRLVTVWVSERGFSSECSALNVGCLLSPCQRLFRLHSTKQLVGKLGQLSIVAVQRVFLLPACLQWQSVCNYMIWIKTNGVWVKHRSSGIILIKMYYGWEQKALARYPTSGACGLRVEREQWAVHTELYIFPDRPPLCFTQELMRSVYILNPEWWKVKQTEICVGWLFQERLKTQRMTPVDIVEPLIIMSSMIRLHFQKFIKS